MKEDVPEDIEVATNEDIALLSSAIEAKDRVIYLVDLLDRKLDQAARRLDAEGRLRDEDRQQLILVASGISHHMENIQSLSSPGPRKSAKKKH